MYGCLTYIVLNHCTYKLQKKKKEKLFEAVLCVTQTGPRIHYVAKDAIELLMPLLLPLQVLGLQAFVTMPSLCSAGDLTDLRILNDR